MSTTGNIKYIKDENEAIVLPVTHERGVVDSSGVNLETKLAGKQATLVSGTNIKTINNNSILGSGNITIEGGGNINIDDNPTSGSSNAVSSGGVYTALSGKQETITTVNVSVDNNTGTPSGTASVSGGTLNLSLSNIKGQQGNTGSSVNYPYELVNNLTTNDATKGLSAAQGVVLEGEIGQLDSKLSPLRSVTADGFSFADSDGNIMVSINENGLDAAKLSSHFLRLIPQPTTGEADPNEEVVKTYGLPLLDKMRAKVIEHNLNNRFLNFAFITDTHTEGTHQIYDLNAIKNMKLFRIFCNEKIVDFGIHCGDLYTDYATSREEALNLIDSSTQILCDVDCPMFFVKGNHDNNGKGRYEADLSNLDWNNNSYYIAKVSNYGLANASFAYERVYENTWDGESTLYVGGNVKALSITKYQYYLLTQKLSDGEVTRNASDLYGAYYYKDYNELGIRVVMLNFYDREVQDNTYGYWEAGGLSATQLTWLSNVALDTENEVLVFSHWYDADLTSALSTFVNNGGNLIALIHGHAHEDQYVNSGGFNNIGVRNGFGIATEMEADQNKSFAFSVFTIDTVNKILYETRVGNGEDRNFSYDTPSIINNG